jgi:hypothetical protein
MDLLLVLSDCEKRERNASREYNSGKRIWFQTKTVQQAASLLVA